MTREIISKAYAYQFLKKVYPLKPGDTITFQLSEALFVLGYKGNSYSGEINEFIKELKEETRRW